MGALKDPFAAGYDTDFVAWTERQATALKRGDENSDA